MKTRHRFTGGIIVLLLTSGSVCSQSEYVKMEAPAYTSGQEYALITYGNIGFSTFCDEKFKNQFLKYWKDISKITQSRIIDTAACSLFGSQVIAYRSEQYQDYVIIWVSEHEYDSEMHLFYIKDKQIFKAGNLTVRRTCEGCEGMVYPVEKIRMTGTDSSVALELLIPYEYMVSPDKWLTCQPGQKEFVVDKKNKKLNVR